MADIARKWRKLLASIKVFVGGCILLIICGVIYSTYVTAAQDGCIVRHKIIISTLKDHVDSGGQIPESISELAGLAYTGGNEKFKLGPSISFERERNDLKYYPCAWSEPGRILLQSSVCGSYVITFGDGSLAVMSYWHRQLGEKQEEKLAGCQQKGRLQASGTCGAKVVIVFFILLVVFFFFIMVIERIMKRRQSKSEQISD